MDASDFLRGGCYALAAWLHLKTELPIYGLFDDHGLMHHAMVGDHDGQALYDARGKVSADWAHMIRGRRCMGTNLREATLQDLRDLHELTTAMGGINPTERQIINFARKTPALRELVEAGPVSAPAPSI